MRSVCLARGGSWGGTHIRSERGHRLHHMLYRRLNKLNHSSGMIPGPRRRIATRGWRGGQVCVCGGWKFFWDGIV